MITSIGAFLLTIGFSLFLFIIFYKFIDLIFWLMEGHWLNHMFYDFFDWIGITYWDTAFMTGWIGFDSLVYEYIILKSFAYGTSTLSGLLCGLGALIIFFNRHI